MAIFLIIVLAIILFWPYISRWIARLVARRMEDMVRRQFGMPPRKEEERQKRERGGENDSRYDRGYGGRQRRGYYSGDSKGGPIIPPEYAEDIEYTETIDYSEDTEVCSDGKSTRVYHESQVSDVQYVEIKDK